MNDRTSGGSGGLLRRRYGGTPITTSRPGARSSTHFASPVESYPLASQVAERARDLLNAMPNLPSVFRRAKVKV